MVAGHIIDALVDVHARVRGVRGAADEKGVRNRESGHNFVLCHRLSSKVKWAFWWTNAPYWMLCAWLTGRSWPSAYVPWHECLRRGKDASHLACS